MTTLPERYKHALRALKDQASAVTAQINGATKQDWLPRLRDAQARMATYRFECGKIVRYLMNHPDQNLNIETLTEAHIAEWLG